MWKWWQRLPSAQGANLLSVRICLCLRFRPAGPLVCCVPFKACRAVTHAQKPFCEGTVIQILMLT